MPLRIAICDDDVKQCTLLQSWLAQWEQMHAISLIVISYQSTEQFLFHYDNHPCDLLLLDIEMNGTSGMHLARQLRKKNDMLPIIFITGFSAYMQEGYDVDALHYLLKPVQQEKLFAALDKFLAHQKDSRQILLPCTDATIRICEDDILYCEAFGKKTQVTCINSASYCCNLGISQLADQLSRTFILCHRSYLVHLGHIHIIRKTELILDNGQTLPLSRRLYDLVNRTFIAYYKERSL